jgi:hypothetical protein
MRNSKRPFRTALALLVTALCCAPCVLAANSNEQACILKAADTLPKIQGMKIGKGRTSPAPGAPAGWLRVEMDWESAGQKATWAYLCATDGTGNARVQRLAQ